METLINDMQLEIMNNLNPLARLLLGMTCHFYYKQWETWVRLNIPEPVHAFRRTGIWSLLDRYGTVSLLCWSVKIWQRPDHFKSTEKALQTRNWDVAEWLLQQEYQLSCDFAGYMDNNDTKAMSWCYDHGYGIVHQRLDRVNCCKHAEWLEGKTIYNRPSNDFRYITNDLPPSYIFHHDLCPTCPSSRFYGPGFVSFDGDGIPRSTQWRREVYQSSIREIYEAAMNRKKLESLGVLKRK